MRQVAGEFQTIPIGSKQARFSRIYVRYQDVINTSGLEPLDDFSEDFPRLVYMFQNVKAGHDVESLRSKRSVQNVSYEYLPAGACFGSLGHRFRHFNAVKLPALALERLEKCTGTAAKIKDPPALPVSVDRRFSGHPAPGRILSGRLNEPVIGRAIVLAHFGGSGRMLEPDQGASRATPKRIDRRSSMESIWRTQALDGLLAPANRTLLLAYWVGAGHHRRYGACGHGSRSLLVRRYPVPGERIVALHQPGGIPGNHTAGGKATGHDGIGPHHAIVTQCQFAFPAKHHGAVP